MAEILIDQTSTILIIMVYRINNYTTGFQFIKHLSQLVKSDCKVFAALLTSSLFLPLNLGGFIIIQYQCHGNDTSLGHSLQLSALVIQNLLVLHTLLLRSLQVSIFSSRRKKPFKPPTRSLVIKKQREVVLLHHCHPLGLVNLYLFFFYNQVQNIPVYLQLISIIHPFRV